MKISNLVWGCGLTFGMISLTACLVVPKDEDATIAFHQVQATSLDTTDPLQAFQQTFYNFARDNCVTCHISTISPYFAADNVNSAYAVAKDAQYVNFTSPASSKFVTYAGNGHCGQSGCANNSAAVTDLITQWANVEIAAAASGGSGGGTPTNPGTTGPITGSVNPNAIVTTTMNLPALPTNGTFIPLRWELSAVTPASPLLAGALFEIEAQRLSDDSYRIRNPRIVGLKQVTRVTNIHVYIKAIGEAGVGTEDVGAGTVWSNGLVSNVPVVARPANLPTGPITAAAALSPYAMVIGVHNKTTGDAMTIAFDAVTSGAALTSTFSSIYDNILVPRCVSCHGSGAASAGVRYDTYAQTLNTVAAGNPNGSALVQATSGTNASMPPSGAKLNTAELNAITTWITNGAQNN